MKDNIIDELRNARFKEDPILDKLVLDLYKKCLTVVKMKNKNNITNMIYDIPYIFIGFPLYPQEIVAVKLNKYLKKQGFKTIYKAPDKIYINW
jgi:hypothetical protein